MTSCLKLWSQVRAVLDAASARAERGRQASALLARALLDGLADAEPDAAALAKLARSATKLAAWREVPAAAAAAEPPAAAADEPPAAADEPPAAAAAPAAAEEPPAAAAEEPPAAAAAPAAEPPGDVVGLAVDACGRFHDFAVVARTKVPANPSPRAVARVAAGLLGRALDRERAARRAAGRLAAALAAAAAAAAPAPGPAAAAPHAAAAASLLELALAVARCLVSTPERRATNIVEAGGDFDVPLRVLAADPGAASTRRVAVAALHMYSRFDDFELDWEWAPLASSAAVFLPGSTTKATWAQYAADEWKWPFLHASSDADLAVVLAECARVTRADAGLGPRHPAAATARAAIAAAAAAAPGAGSPPATFDDVDGDEDAMNWLDDVVAAARDAAAAPAAAAADVAVVESLARPLNDVAVGGLVVVLGGGHNGLADLLADAGVLGALEGYVYFDVCPAAVSLAEAHWPAAAPFDLEVPGAHGDWPAGDVAQLLDPARRAAILRGRRVAFVLSTPSCRAHARVNRRRAEAATDDVDLFLAAERALAADAAAAGHPAPHGALEAGDAPPEIASLIGSALGRAVFRRDAAAVSALRRARTFAATYAVPAVAAGDARGTLAPRTVLDAYLDAEGDAALLPEWGRGHALFDERAKARTPRAFAPPPARPLDRAPAAALARAHGGVNFAAPPPRGGAAPRWHALGVKATSVLMGYAADRFTRAAGLVNDAAASWRALGNTIQKDVLASVVAPWIDALKAARDA